MSVSTSSEIQPAGDNMSAFYFEIGTLQDSLQKLNHNVSCISDLHSQSLIIMDDAAIKRNARQLDGLIEDTVALIIHLKGRIKELQQKIGTGRDSQIRQQQTGLVKHRFVEALQSYQQVERQYREKYKQHMERQFKIVKPDATSEEVTAAVNNDHAGQIFAEALQSSTRYGESRAAYREVRARQSDIRRIEKTLSELAQILNDMSLIVEQHDETIEAIQTTAIDVERHAQAGLDHTKRAVVSARAARRKRWICFIIILIILAVVGIVVGVTVPHSKH